MDELIDITAAIHLINRKLLHLAGDDLSPPFSTALELINKFDVQMREVRKVIEIRRELKHYQNKPND
ncbi:MAG: hypothetical protein ACYSSI_00155 [Planctomycetota bacterium]|jgi:hypothetical protein